jgi:hypothetical protein
MAGVKTVFTNRCKQLRIHLMCSGVFVVTEKDILRRTARRENERATTAHINQFGCM